MDGSCEQPASVACTGKEMWVQVAIAIIMINSSAMHFCQSNKAIVTTLLAFGISLSTMESRSWPTHIGGAWKVYGRQLFYNRMKEETARRSTRKDYEALWWTLTTAKKAENLSCLEQLLSYFELYVVELEERHTTKLTLWCVSRLMLKIDHCNMMKDLSWIYSWKNCKCSFKRKTGTWIC